MKFVPIVAIAALLALLSACSGGDGPAPVVDRPVPVGWIHDGLRLFRYDSATGVLQRVRLPGSSLPLDDASSDETTGLSAADGPTGLRHLASSPSGRYIAYTLDDGDGQRLLAYDVDAGVETDLGVAEFWGMGFATGRDGLLMAWPRNGNDYTRMTLADLADGAGVPIPFPICDSIESGGFVLVRAQADDGTCAAPGTWKVLSLVAGQLVVRPLVHDWAGREAFFSGNALARAGDGSFIIEVYLRDATTDQENPVALCRLDLARCEQVSPDAWIDRWSVYTARFRSLSWDGRTSALMTWADGGVKVDITEDGVTRTVDPGSTVVRALALEGARGVLLLASHVSGDNWGGFEVFRVDPGQAPRSIWRDAGRPYWTPVELDASGDGGRLMLTEFQEVTGTDVMEWFPVAARALDPASGNLDAPMAGGGAPVLAAPDLGHVLIARDLGPGGFELLDAEPATGSARLLASWADPSAGALRLASNDCDRYECDLPDCLAETPLADHASFVWDGRADTFEVTVEVDVTGQSTLPDGTSETLLTDPDGVEHRLVLDLPPPRVLPVQAGERLTIYLKQAIPDAGDPGQYMIAWDASDAPRAVFVGGTLAALDMRGACGDRECPGVSAGTTECAPEPVPGCGRRLHPPAVIWWPSQGFSWQVEPGAEPMGWPIPAQALATDTPLDGGCAELPSDRAWVWMAP